MSFSLFADIALKHYSEITPQYLKEHQINLLLSDLDNTLATRATMYPPVELQNWIKSLTEAGIGVMIVSNNRSGTRITNFCNNLGIPYVGHAGKPKTGGLLRAMEQGNSTPAHTAMIGDRVLTDILGAKRCGMTAIIVEQIGGHNNLWHGFCYCLQWVFRVPGRRIRKKELENSENG